MGRGCWGVSVAWITVGGGERRGAGGARWAASRFARGGRVAIQLRHNDAGWSSSVARWAHNPEVAGSNPAPATKQVHARDLES